jgi:hypothetical protein
MLVSIVRLKKIIVITGCLYVFFVQFAFIPKIWAKALLPDPLISIRSNSSSTEFRFAKPAYTGFDVLQKAQKDIQRDLGLPENTHKSEIPEDLENRHSGNRKPAVHPLVAGTFLFIGFIGVLAFVVIVYRESKKIVSYERPKEGQSFYDQSLEKGNIQDQLRRVFPDIIPFRQIANLPEPGLTRNVQNAREASSMLAESLDSVLQSVRMSLGNWKDNVALSIFHFDEASGFLFLVSRSSGDNYPPVFVPPQISKVKSDFREYPSQPEKISGSFADGTKVESISFPFFDSMGSPFFLIVSFCGNASFPDNWKDGFNRLTDDLAPYLVDYPRMRYLPVTSSRDESGYLDCRAIENRMLEEMNKGNHLNIRFSVLFIKILPAKEDQEPIESFFHRLFVARLEQVIRSSDTMVSPQTGSYVILLPETGQTEAHYVLARVMDIFEDQNRYFGNSGMRFFSYLREIRPGEPEHPASILNQGSRFDIPSQTDGIKRKSNVSASIFTPT